MKTKIDYRVKGERIYIGLEDSKRTWRLCVRSCDHIVHELGIPAKFENLSEYIKHAYPECTVKLMYEAGFHGFTLHDQLKDIGVACDVIPPHLLVEPKNNKIKTDKRDARRLAMTLQTHDYKDACFVPDKERREDRQISRTMVQIQKKITATKNQIRRELEFHGLDDNFKSGTWYPKDYKDLRGILLQLNLSHCLQFSFTIMMDTLDFLLLKKKELFKELRLLMKKDRYKRQMEIYTSIPGIGKLTAIRFILEWGDLRRFPSGKKLSSYTGMIPSEFSTGDTVRKGHITGQGNSQTRAWLIESAWVAIRKDPILNEKFTAIFNRTRSKKIAIVAVARKIAVRMRSCIITDQLYQIGVVK